MRNNVAWAFNFWFKNIPFQFEKIIDDLRPCKVVELKINLKKSRKQIKNHSALHIRNNKHSVSENTNMLRDLNSVTISTCTVHNAAPGFAWIKLMCPQCGYCVRDILDKILVLQKIVGYFYCWLPLSRLPSFIYFLPIHQILYPESKVS